MAETLDSQINLVLGNVPDISTADPQEVYEALLKVQQAIEILVDFYDTAVGLYVTLNDDQTIPSDKIFSGNVSFTDATNLLGFWGATGIPQPSNINQQALIDNTGGTYSQTLSPIIGTGDDVTINNNLTAIYSLLNEIRAALVGSGLIKGSA